MLQHFDFNQADGEQWTLLIWFNRDVTARGGEQTAEVWRQQVLIWRVHHRHTVVRQPVQILRPDDRPPTVNYHYLDYDAFCLVMYNIEMKRTLIMRSPLALLSSKWEWCLAKDFFHLLYF